MPRRLVLVLVVVVAVAWLGFRAVRAFDQDRHTAEAAAVLAAPDKVSYDLPPVPVFPSRPDIGPSGRFAYRPGTWLSVVDLQGLEPAARDGRYLVFLRNWAGWTRAGAARPGAADDLRGGGDLGGRRRHQRPPRAAGAALVRRLPGPAPGGAVQLRQGRLSWRRLWFTPAKQTGNRSANAGC